MSTRNAVRTRKNKERSKNFTELEKRTVLELISQHREVLKQGRSNNATNKNKQMVWSQICIEVNKRCRAECPRTPAQVKMWYENFKKKCKMRSQEPGSEEGGASFLDGMLWSNINPLVDTVSVKDERRDIPSTMVNPGDDIPVNMSSERLEGSLLQDTESKDGSALPEHMRYPLSHSVASAATPPATMLVSVSSGSPSGRSCGDSRDSSGPLNLSHLEPRVCIHTPPLPADDRIFNLGMSRPSNTSAAQATTNYEDLRRCHRFSKMNQNGSSKNNCCNNNNTGNNNNINDTVVPLSNNSSPNAGNYFCCNSSPTDEEKLYFNAKRQHAIWEHEAKMKILNMELRQKEEIFSLQKQLFLIELKLKMDFWEKNCNK